MFQFYDSTIKSSEVAPNLIGGLPFQFYDSTIKSAERRDIESEIKTSFNSTIVRLKERISSIASAKAIVSILR